MTFNPFGKPPAPAPGGINITSFNQSGGITAHTVNLGGPLPRRLDAALAAKFDTWIPSGSRVVVVAALGDAEAYQFAEQILLYLKGRLGLQVEGIDQAIYMPPIRGTQVDPSMKDGRVQVLVGSNG